MSPDAGSKGDKGSAVKVWFSMSPSPLRFRMSRNASQEEARSILESARFKVNAAVKTGDSADIAKGYGDRNRSCRRSVGSPRDTTITIYVSSSMTTVPSNLVEISPIGQLATAV